MNQPQSITSLVTVPLSSPSHIRPIDFLRPACGGLTYATAYSMMCVLVASPAVLQVAPPLSSMLLLMWAITMVTSITGVFLLSAVVHYLVWQHRLKQEGTAAFARSFEVEMPFESAFELCLAATAQLRRAQIEQLDDEKGRILLRVKGNFWLTVDRQVDISVQRIDVNRSRLVIASVAKVTKLRDKLFYLIWGQKWYPIIISTDINFSRKILNQLVAAVQAVPNWDYKHIPSDSSALWGE